MQKQRQINRKTILKTIAFAIAGLFALVQGLGSAMNGAAAAIKNLPSILGLALSSLQIVISTMATLSFLMNVYFTIKMLPIASKRIVGFFKRFPQLKFSQQIAGVAAVVATLASGVAVGVFTYMSVPVALVGTLSLFGVAVFPPLAAIALVMAIVQFFCVSGLLLNSAIKHIENLTTPRTDEKQSLLPGDNADPKQQRYRKIASLIARGVGVVLLLSSAVFATFVKGDAFLSLLSQRVSTALAWALNIAVIYVASGVLNILLTLDTANQVFHQIGSKIGQGLFNLKQFFDAPTQGFANIIAQAKMKLASAQALWQTDKVLFFKKLAVNMFGTVVALGLGVTLVVNSLARLLINSGGPKVFRPEHSYHVAAGKIAQHATPSAPNPEGMIEAIKTTPVTAMGPPELIAGGSAAVASMTVISSTIFGKKKTATAAIARVEPAVAVAGADDNNIPKSTILPKLMRRVGV